MAGEPGGPLTILAILMEGLLGRSREQRQRRDEQRTRKETLQEQLRQERASEARQREWLERVRNQKSRGAAGDASQEEARQLLGGRGGRRSRLDERFF
jgi:hypothetical protein